MSEDCFCMDECMCGLVDLSTQPQTSQIQIRKRHVLPQPPPVKYQTQESEIVSERKRRQERKDKIKQMTLHECESEVMSIYYVAEYTQYHPDRDNDIMAYPNPTSMQLMLGQRAPFVNQVLKSPWFKVGITEIINEYGIQHEWILETTMIAHRICPGISRQASVINEQVLLQEKNKMIVTIHSDEAKFLKLDEVGKELNKMDLMQDYDYKLDNDVSVKVLRVENAHLRDKGVLYQFDTIAVSPTLPAYERVFMTTNFMKKLAEITM